MNLVTDLLLLLIVVQTALKISLWPRLAVRAVFCLTVGMALVLVTDAATAISKTQVEAWLHNMEMMQEVAVVCILDALLHRFKWYPGLLIYPAATYLLLNLLYACPGIDFGTIAWLTAAGMVGLLLLLSVTFNRLLPQPHDRLAMFWCFTIMVCVVSLLGTQQTITVFPANQQNIIMEYISKALFGIANIMLIPDIVLLIVFFFRALFLLASTYKQYLARRNEGHSPLYTRYAKMLYEHDPDEAYADYLSTLFEDEAAKDVNLSRLLTKLGPVLGLIGTLISMSPALVGLSEGDISGMAYNMQVVFSATVVGLFISVVGLFSQQLKARWYAKDLGKLDYVSRIYVERHEKEA